MKRFLILALTLAALAPPAARADVCAPPRCLEDVVPASYGANVPDRRFTVLVPRGYDPAGARRYPVLYLLHGAGDTFQTWVRNTDLLSLTAGLELIVVMPDGGRNAEAGWYSDWKDGSRQWETFHTAALVAYVDTSYKTMGPGHRAVSGLSMGGFGAMHYAARHPALFQAAATFSGAVDTMYLAPASGVGFTLFHNQFGTPDDRVWGNQVTDEQTWRANNPTDLVDDLRGALLLIATGNGLPGGAHEDPSNPGGYGIEQFIWQMNLSFVRALDSAGVPHTDLFYGPGQHSWPYWRDALAWALPQLLARIA